ncbi:MAG TPA: nuclear transport factor 2 family protein [Candidatus Eisenbacteria bacterium]|nr:nuclear transport factor 2 family protein [Candidatus Eisenbacteria bacterium]
MRRILTLATLLALVASPTAPHAQKADASDARAALSKLYSAIARGDSGSASPLLDPGLIWVIGNGGATLTRSQLLAAASHPAPVRFEIDSLRAHRYASTVVADYVRRDRWRLGLGGFTTSWRALAVFVPGDRGWRLVRHTLTWLAHPALPIALAPAALEAFVGRYRIAPGYVDDVHLEAGHLVATASGQTAGARLVPVSTTAFSPDGVGAVIAFERDAHGRVTGYVQAYPDGRVVRAKRLP